MIEEKKSQRLLNSGKHTQTQPHNGDKLFKT